MRPPRLPKAVTNITKQITKNTLIDDLTFRRPTVVIPNVKSFLDPFFLQNVLFCHVCNRSLYTFLSKKNCYR